MPSDRHHPPRYIPLGEGAACFRDYPVGVWDNDPGCRECGADSGHLYPCPAAVLEAALFLARPGRVRLVAGLDLRAGHDPALGTVKGDWLPDHWANVAALLSLVPYEPPRFGSAVVAVANLVRLEV